MNNANLEKKNKFNILLILFSILIVLFLIELYLKNFSKIDKLDEYWKERYTIYQEGDVFKNYENFFTYFPNRLILNETYYYVNENFVKEFSYYVETNNFGLVQNTDLEKEISSILFLGDSVVEGHGAFGWLNNFNGNFKNHQIINGGILGTGFEQFELMEKYLDKTLNIKKVVVLYIGDDLRRKTWLISQDTIQCLKNYNKCKGYENFYGFDFNQESIIPFLTKLKNFRDNREKEYKSSISFKKIRKSIKSFFKELYIVKLTVKVLKKKIYKSKNPQIIKNLESLSRLNKKYGNNIIFIRMITKDEILNNVANYESFYAQNYIKQLTSKHFICDLERDLKSYYKYDAHPNAEGYSKLYRCVKKIISKNFIYE